MTIPPEHEELFLQQDHQDLAAILQMRYGEIPLDVQHRIDEITDLNQMQRMMIVACNAPDFEVFLEELNEGEHAYKLTGERFNPMGTTSRKG